MKRLALLPAIFSACFLAPAQRSAPIAFGSALGAQERIRESAQVAKNLAAPAAPEWRAKGDLHRKYWFAAAAADMPYRPYIPSSWNGKSQLPLIVMLHGVGNDENGYMDRNGKQLLRLAEQHATLSLRR